MKNVWVFSTSLTTPLEVARVAAGLDELAGPGNWHFDLEDCDRVLRVVTDGGPGAYGYLLQLHGFRCEELSDEVPGEELTAYKRVAS